MSAIKTGTWDIVGELAARGYKRVAYNHGAFVACMKAFNKVKDPQDVRAMRVEVRFGEYPDRPLQAYIVLPMSILPLPELKTVEDIEALYELLAKGRGRK